MREETDSLGKISLPENAYYGINTQRSKTNFISTGEKVNPYLIKAYLQVKKAAIETNYKCGLILKEKYELISDAIEELLKEIEQSIERKSDTIYEKIIVDPYQGGAGTSLNMNINEVIANTALEKGNRKFGDYKYIHPLDDVNMSQSTNDTFPTAVKIAGIVLLRKLADSFAFFQRSLQKKEEEFKGILKLGRTQYQDAVPIALGQEFGAYAQAIARDRWRIYNSEERIRSVNMGGTAVGNSVSATRKYVLNVNGILKKITGLPIAKGEDLIDTTQNLDVFVETHGIVKAGATSVIKICNDLRFLSSGPNGGIGEINLPAMQSGSSIMPGKINPVILENSIQICEMIKSNDSLISNMVSSGHLELNPFLPIISHTYLKSIWILSDTLINLSEKCIDGITANEEKCKSNLINTSAIAASLIPVYGYDTIQEVVKYAEKNKITFAKALIHSKIIDENELYSVLSKEMGLNIE